MKRDLDVLLCGYYGFGNLGDELLARSVIGLVEEQGVPRRRIGILSATPEETSRACDVEAFDRWSLSSIARGLARSKSLVLGGGGLFQDSTSIRSPFYYWAVVRMASLFGCVPWCFGQSVGPLRTFSGRYLARSAIKRCVARYVRDESSRIQVEKWGLDCAISPDLVISLPVSVQKGPESYILVNVRPWSDNLPERFAEALVAYSEEKAMPILGVGLAGEDIEIMEDLKARCLLPEHMPVRLLEPENLSEVFGQGSLAVGMRLHFNVLALIHGLSCIAVPYDPKVEAFANAWDVPAWKGKGPLPERAGNKVLPENMENARRMVRTAFSAAWATVEKEILR